MPATRSKTCSSEVKESPKKNIKEPKLDVEEKAEKIEDPKAKLDPNVEADVKEKEASIIKDSTEAKTEDKRSSKHSTSTEVREEKESSKKLSTETATEIREVQGSSEKLSTETAVQVREEKKSKRDTSDIAPEVQEADGDSAKKGSTETATEIKESSEIKKSEVKVPPKFESELATKNAILKSILERIDTDEEVSSGSSCEPETVSESGKKDSDAGAKRRAEKGDAPAVESSPKKAKLEEKEAESNGVKKPTEAETE